MRSFPITITSASWRLVTGDKKAYCLYHPTIKRHTLWVGNMEELDKKYRDGEIDPLRGITVYQPDDVGGSYSNKGSIWKKMIISDTGVR